MKIRVEVSNRIELDTFVELLEQKYFIKSISKAYKNRNDNNFRYYICVENN